MMAAGLAGGDATAAFSRHNFLDERTPLSDGFYDCGRGWGATMAKMGGPAELLRLVAADGAKHGREVTLFDSRSDRELEAFAAGLVADLSQLAATPEFDFLRLVRTLAFRVADRLGGHGESMSSTLAAACIADMPRLRRARSDAAPASSPPCAPVLPCLHADESGW